MDLTASTDIFGDIAGESFLVVRRHGIETIRDQIFIAGLTYSNSVHRSGSPFADNHGIERATNTLETRLDDPLPFYLWWNTFGSQNLEVSA
jgi:hypothetical protein